MDIWKFFERIVNLDFVIPDLVTPETGLDRWPAKDLSNVCLRRHTLKERLYSPLLLVFRPDRINVDRSKGNLSIAIKRDRDRVIAVSVGEDPWLLDGGACQTPTPPFPGIRRDHIVALMPPDLDKVRIAGYLRDKARETMSRQEDQERGQNDESSHRSLSNM
jgi:hypothetical protein